MAKPIVMWGPTPADTTAETVFTNVTGKCATLESLNVQQPNGSAATEVVLSVGVDGATTRVLRYPIPAGSYSNTFYPNLKITGTTVLQLSSTVTDDVCITYASGREEAV